MRPRDLLFVGVVLSIPGLVFAVLRPDPVVAENAKPVEIVHPLPLPTMSPTHIGVPVEDMVTLLLHDWITLPEGQRLTFRRGYPDGSQESEVFVVPFDKFLVVTDVDWGYVGYAENNRGRLTVGFSGPSLGFAPRMMLWANTGAGEMGFASGSDTTGFAMGPLMSPLVLIGPGLQLDTVMIRGYLVDAPPAWEPRDPIRGE